MSFLVGVSEVGKILGWDRRKVSTYHLRGVLPKPLVDLSSGPIWSRKQIEYYKAYKELDMVTYFINKEKVYQCRQNDTLLETTYSPEEVKEHKGNHILLWEEDITQVRNAIMGKSSIVQFFSFDFISFLYDVGLMEKGVLEQYLSQVSYETINLAKKGWDERTC